MDKKSSSRKTIVKKKKPVEFQQKNDPKSEKRQALSKVFSCPNLPLYIYFKNWNYLVNSEMFNLYTPRFRDLYCWKQNLQKLGKFNMTSEETKFNLLKERLEENPNKKALWGLDLQKLFETKEEDIKKLIDSSIKPSQEFLNIQKKDNALIETHNNLIFEDDAKAKNLILSKGSPQFYNSDGDLDDGLINFHNKQNRNLFCRKNFKLLKIFYDNKNIKDDKEDEETKKDGETKRDGETKKDAETKYDTLEDRQLNDLDDNQIEYLLEQRAFAMKNLNKRLDVIKDKFPLKQKLKPDFRKTQSNNMFVTGLNKTSSNFRTTRTRMNNTARNHFTSDNNENSYRPPMEKSMILDLNAVRRKKSSNAFTDISNKNNLHQDLDSKLQDRKQNDEEYRTNVSVSNRSIKNNMLKTHSIKGIRSQKPLDVSMTNIDKNMSSKEMPKSRGYSNQNIKPISKDQSSNLQENLAKPKGNVFTGGFGSVAKNVPRTKHPDLHVKKSEIKSFQNLLNKIHELSEIYSAEDLNEKTGIIVQLYQKINKIIPAHENFFETFKEKYEDFKLDNEMRDFEHHIKNYYSGYENTIESINREVNLQIEDCDRIKHEKIQKNRTAKEITEIKNKAISNFRIKSRVNNVTKISDYKN